QREPDRLPPAAGFERAVDLEEPLPAHPPDAPARLPLPGRQRGRLATPSGRPRLEGHGGGLSQPDRRRAAGLRLLQGRLRLPLPCRRARRHVDDGADGGGRMTRASRSHASATARLAARSRGGRLLLALCASLFFAAPAQAATRAIQAYDTPSF